MGTKVWVSSSLLFFTFPSPPSFPVHPSPAVAFPTGLARSTQSLPRPHAMCPQGQGPSWAGIPQATFCRRGCPALSSLVKGQPAFPSGRLRGGLLELHGAKNQHPHPAPSWTSPVPAAAFPRDEAPALAARWAPSLSWGQGRPRVPSCRQLRDSTFLSFLGDNQDRALALPGTLARSPRCRHRRRRVSTCAKPCAGSSPCISSSNALS